MEFEIFGAPFIDSKDFLKLIVRFAINLSFILAIVRWVYYRSTPKKQYLFTFLLLANIIFLLCFLLDNIKLDLGFALGLFAIFGIIRYRTDPIPIREMTYLFLVIGLSVINALVNKKVSYIELFFTNGIILMMTYGMEYIWFKQRASKKRVLYEKIALIIPEQKQELIEDLQIRLGLPIFKVEIGDVDFLKDTAELKVYYHETA